MVVIKQILPKNANTLSFSDTQHEKVQHKTEINEAHLEASFKF